MAWIKCNTQEYIPPIPVGQTFTTGVYTYAYCDETTGEIHHVGNGVPADIPLTTMINVKKVASMTVHVKWWASAYASGSYGTTWESSCDNHCTYTFKVGNITDPSKYHNEKHICDSENNGWVRKSDEFDFYYTAADFRGYEECPFFLNVNTYFYQNGDQIDPQAEAYISFTITNVTYK